MAKTSSARIIALNPSESFSPGENVYLTEEYYHDFHATILEIPRFGWRVKALLDGVATIEYQRPNLKLLMSLMLETKYLKKEV